MIEDNGRERCCGNCKFHGASKDTRDKEFYCYNVASEGYGLPTDFEDLCEDWEEEK